MSCPHHEPDHRGDAEKHGQLPRATAVLDGAAAEPDGERPAADHADGQHHESDRQQNRPRKLRQEDTSHQYRAAEDRDGCHAVQRNPHGAGCRREE